MVLVDYYSYITYTLTELLLDLDQRNVCRDLEKIEGLIRDSPPIPNVLSNVVKDRKLM